jgi:phosphocarrier protein
MIKFEETIRNKDGLHPRLSAVVALKAGMFKSEIWALKDGRRVNAKSVMGVMMLAAGCGSVVGWEVDGEDENDAMSALVDLFRNKLVS